MKQIAYLAILLILSSMVIALDCDYTDIVVVGQKEVIALYVNGDQVNNPLQVRNFRNNVDSQGRVISQSFEVHNILDVPINVTVEFIAISVTYRQTAEIVARSFVTLGGIAGIENSTITFIYNKNNYSEGKWRTEDIEEIQCRKCPPNSEKICVNDRGSCTSNSVCGGGYCVDDECSSSFGCGSGKIQCKNEEKCVQIASVNNGNKPICGLSQECKSGYIEPRSGECKARYGDSCTLDSECVIGLFCDMNNNKCSNGTCYKNDCNCKSDEVQCSDNTRCVKIGTLEIGHKVSCMSQECKKQQYCSILNNSDCKLFAAGLDTYNMTCTESPEIISMRSIEQRENDRIIQEGINERNSIFNIAMLIIVVSGIIIFFIYRSKLEKQIQATIDKKIHIEIKKHERIMSEIELTNKRLEEIKSTSLRIRERQRSIIKLEEEISGLEKTIKTTTNDVSRIEELKKERMDELKQLEMEIQKRHSDIEELKTGLMTIEDDLVRCRRELSEFNRNKTKNSSERKELERDIKDLESKHEQKKELLDKLIKDDEECEKQRLKPKINPQGHIVIIDEQGYERFEKDRINPSVPGERFHRWFATKYIYDAHPNYQYYKHNSLSAYEVHHIDQNKRNNDLKNLAIVPVNHESIMMHKNIHDYKSGVAELKRVGIRQPHISELNK